MSVIPTRIVDEIVFGEEHAALWAANRVALGLSQQEVDAVNAAVLDARKEFADAVAARTASRGATNDLRIAMQAMHPLLANIVQQIRLTAEATNNPNLYTLGGIPEPAKPQPAPPPGQPIDLGAQIRPQGVLRITFKTTETAPGAVTYIVSRKLASESAFTVIGTTGSSSSTSGANLPRGYRFFDDTNLPGGSNNMQYMVQAQRGTSYGTPSMAMIVTIGVGAGGGMVVTGTDLKMAA